MPALAEPAPGPFPVTVVIATRDRPTMLHRCLQAVRQAMRPGDGVVVVDSASTDPTVRRVAEAAGARVVRCERPGTCRARNAGWRAASSDVVLFTDDDCTPTDDWVHVTAELFDRWPAVDFVTGAVHPDVPITGRAQLGTSLLTGGISRSFGDRDAGSSIGHGANMAWRRPALERIGGFDEALGPGTTFRGAEDHDAFLRALRAGSLGRFEPASVVIHHQWRNRRGQLWAYFGYGVGTGACAVKGWRLDGTSPDVVPDPAEHDGVAGAPGGAIPALPWGSLVRHGGRSIVWEDGVRAVGRSLRDHFEMAAVGETVKVAGELWGAVLARHAALDPSGCFVAP